MDKSKILVVDDEVNIVELLSLNLKRFGYEVITAFTGMEAITKTSVEKPDLILLDIMLPDSDGIELCSMIRSNNLTKNTPIILVSAKSEESDKIQGLLAGADDYITKPFSLKEIDARIQTVLRRASKNVFSTESKSIVKKGDISIDKNKYEVYRKENKVDLTLSEFKLLSKMFDYPNVVHTREDLLNEISSDREKTDERTIDVHIRNIRKKLETDGEDYIETVRGIGYRLKWDYEKKNPIKLYTNFNN